jgi:hypothetical protein
MTLEEIKTLFNQVIAQSSWWSKFKSSEFVTYIVTFVAQIYFRANQLSARRLQESFLSLAVKASSILAHSESRGYVARKRIPTKVTLFITNNGDTVMYMPKYTALYSSDGDLDYLLTEAVTIPAGETVETNCIQGEIVYFENDVTESKKYLTKELDVTTSKAIAEIYVSVTDPEGNENEYASSYMFRNATSKTLAYVEYYSASQQVGIRFGNGISGYIPTLGSKINLECITTEGFTEIASNQALTVLDDDTLNAALVIVTGDTLVVGSDREDIETSRNNALYHTNYDNTVVFDADHAFFTRRSIGGLTWFRAWGEKEQETLMGAPDLDFIGNVYISAYHPNITQAKMLESLAETYSAVKVLNIVHVPVACQLQPFTVTINATILTSNNPATVLGVVENALNAAFSSSVADHDGVISYNAIWRTLESTGLLTSFNVTVNADLDVPAAINTFRFLDVASSDINIAY